jgi:hypothetical protein
MTDKHSSVRKIEVQVVGDAAPEPEVKPEPEPEPTTMTLDKEKYAAMQEVVKAARALDRGWLGTGFFDRQDLADGIALHEALEGLR